MAFLRGSWVYCLMVEFLLENLDPQNREETKISGGICVLSVNL